MATYNLLVIIPMICIIIHVAIINIIIIDVSVSTVLTYNNYSVHVYVINST